MSLGQPPTCLLPVRSVKLCDAVMSRKLPRRTVAPTSQTAIQKATQPPGRRQRCNIPDSAASEARNQILIVDPRKGADCSEPSMTKIQGKKRNSNEVAEYRRNSHILDLFRSFKMKSIPSI